MQSWKLGIKANALYRDGSKLSQPLNSISEEEVEAIMEEKENNDIVKVAERIIHRYIAKRRRLPDRRTVILKKQKLTDNPFTSEPANTITDKSVKYLLTCIEKVLHSEVY